MSSHPAAVTAAHLDVMMADIQYFLAHPRIQQRRWVEKGHSWMPLLQQAKAHLLALASAPPVGATATAPFTGLAICPRDSTTWGYSWNGLPLKGTYATFTQALEAALREQLPKH